MKHTVRKLTAVILASILLMALIPATASAAVAGPSAPSFGAVMRHTPHTLFPVPGTAVLEVTDAETGLPVAGAKYDLYRISAYGGKDTKVASSATNKDGLITVSHAMTGSFYWVAAGETEGYAADETKHEFSVIGAHRTVTGIALAKPVIEEEAEEEPAAIAEEEAAVETEAEAETDAVTDLLFGGWDTDVDPEITDELKAIFEKGIEGLLGVTYEPYSYYASQIVAGRNHCFLCTATPVVPDAEPYFAFVFLYEDLEGNVELTKIITMDEFLEGAFDTIDSLLGETAAILGE